MWSEARWSFIGSALVIALGWLKYCVASRCLAMIVAEQATEALPLHHWTSVGTNVPSLRDWLVAEPLMNALRMVVC
jgi:hypothetical protein